ncbi:MAG: hypothetical protein WAP51_00105 [Candidatus Sungiibacteriota bacterium]
MKQIVSPGDRTPKRKTVIQDIIPKGSAARFTKKVPGISSRPLPKETPAPVKPALQKREEPPLPELNVKRWEPSARPVISFKNVKLGRRFLISTGVFTFILSLIVLSTSFAKLTVTVRPVSAEVPISPLTVVAETKILALNTDAKKIPGLKIAIEKTYQETFPSSGKKYIEDFARGRISIFNAFSSAPQVLVAGTRFTESSGKTFKLAKTITIPGAAVEEGKIIPNSIETDVVAEKAGQDYNIPPTDFSIPGFKGTPKYAAFYGKSKDAFSGGFKGEARIVTLSDIKNAQEKVSRVLFDQLRSALQEKLPTGDEFISLDGSRNVLIESIKNPKADERGDNFTASASGRAEMIIFKKSDLLALLGSLLLSPDRPSTILTDSFKPAYKNVRLDTKSGQLSFSVEGKATAIRIVPTEEIKSAATSKSVSKLEAYLRDRPEIAGFVVKNFPVWRWRTPSRPEAIEVNLELPKEGG